MQGDEEVKLYVRWALLDAHKGINEDIGIEEYFLRNFRGHYEF